MSVPSVGVKIASRAASAATEAGGASRRSPPLANEGFTPSFVWLQEHGAHSAAKATSSARRRGSERIAGKDPRIGKEVRLVGEENPGLVAGPRVHEGGAVKEHVLVLE